MFPATEARIREEVAGLGQQGHRWVVVEAALLLEAKWDVWVRVSCVYCIGLLWFGSFALVVHIVSSSFSHFLSTTGDP